MHQSHALPPTPLLTHDDGGDSRATASIIQETQLESATELVNAISSFIWSLDCLWDTCAKGDDDALLHGAENGDNDRAANLSDDPKSKSKKHGSSQEPHTEWNEEAKSLIREGYGLIITCTSSSSQLDEEYVTSITDSSKQHNQHHDELRTLVREEILNLLPSLSTSACRHFLLAFLPHFMPLAILSGKVGGDGVNGDDDQYWNAPSWLARGGEPKEQFATGNYSEYSQSSKERYHNTLRRVLDTFQSLIETDASTLVPFLSTLSLLFENLPEGGAFETAMITQNAERMATDDATMKASNVREECFNNCLTSLPSISEHDLPSLLHSLFSVVRNEEEGRLTMEAVRKEWAQICRSDDNDNNEGGDSAFFIGNVIIQSFLSEQLPGASALAIGFLDAVGDSLRIYYSASSKQNSKAGTQHDVERIPLTTLDVIILTALHSHRSYQNSVESIIDSLIHHQSFSFFDLILSLISSWKKDGNNPRSRSIGGGRHTNLLLYDTLASPLISVLFYIMITTSSYVGKDGCTNGTLVGGVLSFRDAKSVPMTESRRTNVALSIACCRVASSLYSALDPQRQDQIVNSLLSMISDSFVQSSPYNATTKRNRATIYMDLKHSRRLLTVSANAACRTLLILAEKHPSDLSKIRGVVLDRMLLLASMVPSTVSDEQSESDTMYSLFDMSCALIVALMQGNVDSYESGNAVGSGASELLIICQKLLFSTSFSSTTAALANVNHQHRLKCGIILASRLLRCKRVSRSERGNIWGWVLSILPQSQPLASKRTSSVAGSPNISETETSHWILSFLQFASSSIPQSLSSNTAQTINGKDRYSYYPEITQLAEKNSVCGESDVFAEVNKMLATVGMIQMEDSLKLPAAAPVTFLGFNNMPFHYSFHHASHKSKPTHSFVICSPYFLSEKLMQQDHGDSTMLTSIHLVSEYVYDLVDHYLQLGTGSTGWNPRAWLLAKIQLPYCLSPSTMQLLGMDHHILELDTDISEAKEGNSRGNNPQTSWKNLLAAILDEPKSKVAMVKSIVEFANNIIVSISVSSAVLKHAHNHFQRIVPPDDESSGTKEVAEDSKLGRKNKRQAEALRKLLQFQLAKILSLQQICRTILLALKGLYAEICRANRKPSMVKREHTKHTKQNGETQLHTVCSFVSAEAMVLYPFVCSKTSRHYREHPIEEGNSLYLISMQLSLPLTCFCRQESTRWTPLSYGAV